MTQEPLNNVPRYDPPLQEGHWTKLPFPFLEMQTKPITLDVSGGVIFTGTTWIDQHPKEPSLYSLCVSIPHVPISLPPTLDVVRVRLRPIDIARISRLPSKKQENRFHLVGSQIEMLGMPFPPQIKGKDGKTAHL